jgi:hypothetical protein
MLRARRQGWVDKNLGWTPILKSTKACWASGYWPVMNTQHVYHYLLAFCLWQWLAAAGAASKSAWQRSVIGQQFNCAKAQQAMRACSRKGRFAVDLLLVDAVNGLNILHV